MLRPRSSKLWLLALPLMLFLLFRQCLATPSLSVATASAYFTPGSCTDSQTAQGPTQATASAACGIPGGNQSSAIASAGFSSLASNILNIDAISISTVPTNVYTDSTAEWTQGFVVRGGQGTGWVHFNFLQTGTISGSIGDYICEITSNSSLTTPCGSAVGDAHFAFDQPFLFNVQLHVRTIADVFDHSQPPNPPPPIWVTQVNWTAQLTGFTVYDELGRGITGATVEVVPEPGALGLSVIGLLMLTVGMRKRR